MYNASEKQIDFILTLASKVEGRQIKFLSQLPARFCLSQRERTGGMTKAMASSLIDQLKAELVETEG